MFSGPFNLPNAIDCNHDSSLITPRKPNHIGLKKHEKTHLFYDSTCSNLCDFPAAFACRSSSWAARKAAPGDSVIFSQRHSQGSRVLTHKFQNNFQDPQVIQKSHHAQPHLNPSLSEPVPPTHMRCDLHAMQFVPGARGCSYGQRTICRWFTDFPIKNGNFRLCIGYVSLLDRKCLGPPNNMLLFQKPHAPLPIPPSRI